MSDDAWDAPEGDLGFRDDDAGFELDDELRVPGVEHGDVDGFPDDPEDWVGGDAA